MLGLVAGVNVDGRITRHSSRQGTVNPPLYFDSWTVRLGSVGNLHHIMVCGTCILRSVGN